MSTAATHGAGTWILERKKEKGILFIFQEAYDPLRKAIYR